MFRITIINSLLLILLISFPFQAFSLANDNKAMVVTSQHLATRVGVEILKKGGNAIDAAVAVGYALAVVEPCCGNIGGGGFMLIHFADGRNTFINFREKAPIRISPVLFLDANAKVDSKKLNTHYLAVGVPGTVMGLNTALKQYGHLSLSEVLKPAIQLAKNGFILSDEDVRVLQKHSDKFKPQSQVAAVFLKPAGTRLVQTDLANTLSLIAKHGETAFYRGKIADEIVAASNQHQGVLSKKDFTDYSIKEEAPLVCHYRGFQIITTPPPGSGITLCEILNIIELFPLSTSPYYSAKTARFNVEAMRYAYADRNYYLADPDFIKLPIKKLLAKSYAQEIQHKIKNNVVISANDAKNAHEGNNTTSYVIADQQGNVVSVTYTLNSSFGTGLIAHSTGFFLNNEMDDFTIKMGTPNNFSLLQGKANLIAPRKRPLSAMTPTIILDHNRFYMTLGTPGGATIITQLIEVIQNIIDFKMNIQEAVDAPRYHAQNWPDVIFMEERAFSPKTLNKLTMMGYHFQLGSPWGSRQWGAVTVIVKDPQTGLLQGAMDSRRPGGLALGVRGSK